MKCQLCGKEFEKSEAACGSCPFRDGCELIRCPNCGYEFVAESKIVNFFKNMFKRRQKQRRFPCPPNNK